MKVVNVKELTEQINKIIQSNINISTMIWGPPGLGKSSAFRQAAKENNMVFIDVRISQLAPTDLRGLPVPQEMLYGIYVGDAVDKEIKAALDNNNEAAINDLIARKRVTRDLSTVFAAPDFLPRQAPGGISPRVLLLLDEINQATPTMMTICQQLILDRCIGSYKLPDNVWIFAAGNRRSDQAAVNQMPSPTANRMLHLEVVPDVDIWIEYAESQGWMPNYVGTYLRQGGAKKLLDVPSRIEESPSFPSPRSWEMACHLINAGLDPSMAIGQEAANDLQTFKETGKAIDLDAILSGEHPPFPEESDAQLGVAMRLVGKVNTPGKLATALNYLPEGEITRAFLTQMINRLKQQNKIDLWWSHPDLTGNAVAAERITAYVAATSGHNRQQQAQA